MAKGDTTTRDLAQEFIDLMGRFQESKVLLHPKRRKVQAPFDRWYPYYAGYSYTFAKEAIRLAASTTPLTVLDPWNGSGTTLAAASHLGHHAVGIDLNPATLVVAQAKLVDNRGMDRIYQLISEALRQAKSRKDLPLDGHALYEWLPRDLASLSIHALTWLSGQHPLGYSMSEISAATICFLKPLRSQALHRTSNPVWAKPNQEVGLSKFNLEEMVFKAYSDIRSDLDGAPNIESRVSARLGDARSLDLPDSSVDLVLSSPPYCTRIDYAKQTGFEMAALCGEVAQDASVLRSSLMGTTCIRGAQGVTSQPESVYSLLEEIRGHSSTHSAGYYYKNLLQYFNDASLAVSEIARVLRPGGKALLVLQDSYYKEVHIPLSSLYCDIARSHGLLAEVVLDYPVTRTMTGINTRSRKYLKTRTYSEDVVLFWKK